MGAGSGGADAVRMINRATREARAYRADRKARRDALDFRRGEEAGELHTCSSCQGTFDVNFMLRDHDRWTCEACDYAVEADRTLESAASDSLWPAVLGGGAIACLVLLEQLALEPGAGVFWLIWCSVVATAGVLLGTWTEGLRRAGVATPALLAVEAGAVVTVAVYLVRGLANLA